MKLIEILERNRQLQKLMKGPKYNIAVISNITINQCKEPLEFTLRQEGINAEVSIGDYDNIIQDCKRYSKYNAVIVFWEAINLIDGFQNKALTLTAPQLSEIHQKTKTEIKLLTSILNLTPLVLINRFSNLAFLPNVLAIDPLTELCSRLNEFLASSIGSNTLLIDTSAIIAKTGIHKSIDYRQYQNSKALYTAQFFTVFADALKPAFMAVNGRAKKILVLDCDNTLWAGILGEDGDNGIGMAYDSPRGKPFHEAQTILRGFQQQGVILAICSKNNLSEVEAVLTNHPDMVLQYQDFVAFKINWSDKTENLQQLATELNLGLDSFVFLDDSEFEIGLVQAKLPQIECILVPANRSEYPNRVRALGLLFFTPSKTSEDINKTKLYLQNTAREDQATQFTTTSEYLESLQLKLTPLWRSQVPVARAAQMSQKTNQFNLTTPRYTEADISRMQHLPEYILGAFTLKDRYGEYGVSGFIVIKQQEHDITVAQIECFLISCRVIGRQAEYCFLQQVISLLEVQGIRTLHAKYLATPKNIQVADFYDNLGFTVLSRTPQETNYELSLENYKIQGDIFVELAH